MRKRTSKDIWENLYEFVLFESDKLLAPGEKTLIPLVKKLFGKQAVQIKNISPVFRQQLTHQTIIGQFIELETPALPDILKDYELVKNSLLVNYPFPKFITAYMQMPGKPMQLF